MEPAINKKATITSKRDINIKRDRAARLNLLNSAYPLTD